MKRAALGAFLALALLTTACKGDDGARRSASPTSGPSGNSKAVRVGVWLEPDPALGTYGGAIVRSLLFPQLFRVTPDGKFEPSLVEKGSDKTGPGATSATIRLRDGAEWSDGTPITADDLRRTMDKRFVASVDGPRPDGTITLRFTQKLPTWRRLWSGLDVVLSASPASVFGGPFVLAGSTPKLETVLRPNPRFYGDRASVELRLVIVPDPEIAARLMDRGDLDVVAPAAFPVRTERLAAIKNAKVLKDDGRGGWTVALVANPAHLSSAQRGAMLRLADPKRFTDALLRGEASPVGSAGQLPPGDAAAFASRPALSAPYESPPAGLLLQAMQKRGRDRGIGFDLRRADFDDVLGAYAGADYDVLYRLQPPSPATCWLCEAATIDAALAAAADAGDANAARQLQARLVNDGLVLPLWRERSVAAVRDGLEGVSVNSFAAAGVLWNAGNWRWTA